MSLPPFTSPFGWKKDTPDERDFQFQLRAQERFTQPLPALVDLRPLLPAVYDQGGLGSCTANAICAAFQFQRQQQMHKPVKVPSRLFLYFNERVLEDSVSEDAGAELRDGMKTLNKEGVCDETTWPYKIGRFARKPTKTAYRLALNRQSISYERVAQGLNQLRTALAAGYPVVFGFAVFISFEACYDAPYTMPIPAQGEEILGGHAVVAVGYDDERQCFIVRNSWGAPWGDQGHFYMPYSFITNPFWTADFWVLRLVE